MKLIRIACVGALLIPLVGLWSQDAAAAGQKVLTLEQCLDAALSKSDSSAILQKNLEISQAQYKQIVAKNAVSLNAGLGGGATAGFGSDTLLTDYATTVGTPDSYSTVIPLNVSGSLSLTNGSSTSVSLTGGTSFSPAGNLVFNQGLLGLSLSQTVWDGYPGGIAKANVQQGLLNLQNAELATDANKLTLAFQIKQAYYLMLNAQRKIDVDAQNVELQKSALDQEQALYDLQQAVDVDLQTAKINLKSAEVDQKTDLIALVSARKALANLVGLNASEDFSVAETADPQVSAQSLDEAIAVGLDKRVELKQLDVSRKNAAVSLGLIKAQTSPTVILTGIIYGLNGDNSLPPYNQNMWAATIGMGGKINLPILDSGSAAYQEEANRYQNGVYDLQDDQLRRSISLAVENDYKAVQLQTEKLDLAKLTAENSKGQYDLKNVQRQYGTATNQDVLAAAVNMVNASTALATARNALELAILQLQNDMGL
ncbi:MAG: TolC family protein [Rectinemataceae bacterium]